MIRWWRIGRCDKLIMGCHEGAAAENRIRDRWDRSKGINMKDDDGDGGSMGRYLV
jgi:hypothetical protein